jgi:hypothetical protein
MWVYELYCPGNMIYFLMFKCHAFGFLVLPSKFCLQTLKLYPS